MLERFKKIVESKMVETPVVYTGEMVGGVWAPESLHAKYDGIVKITTASDKPEAVIDNVYEFVGGNAHRLVYVKKEEVGRWLEAAAQDSHWAAASMLRPGKLCVSPTVFTWDGYQESQEDEGLLAILDEKDWSRLLQSFDLPADAGLAQVTVFDLENKVSAKGTLRRALVGEKPTVFPQSWKKFGPVRTEYTTILTVDAVYRPRPAISVQELEYWTRGNEPAAWLWEALEKEISRILEFRTTPWTTTGYLTALGFSPAWNVTLASLREHLSGELRKLLRRIKFGPEYGLRAKTTASPLLKSGEVLLPTTAKRYTKVGGTIWVGRNPALPSQGWGIYRVAGYHEGNFVVFPANDKQWSGLLGGDHDGDDAVIFYSAPVEDYEVPEGWLDLQSIKPSGRKLEGNTVEERLMRWQNEVATNIGVFDLAARRLLAVGKLDNDGRGLFTAAIQTVISLKKRVGRIEDQPWYPLLSNLLGIATQLAGSTWMDALREGNKPINGPEWATKLWTRVTEAIAGLNKLQPRLWLTEEKVKAFSRNVEPKDRWVYDYLTHLKRLKAEAIARDDGQLAWQINREIKEFVHVRGPEYLLEIPEEDWKEFSRWLVGNAHSSEWVFLVHPEVLQELYSTFGKEVMVAILREGSHTLAEGDVFEVEEQEAIERRFEIDGARYELLDDTGFIKAGVQYTVTKVRGRVVEFQAI